MDRLNGRISDYENRLRELQEANRRDLVEIESLRGLNRALQEKQQQEEHARLDKERRMQEAQIMIKKRFGKNAILRGLNFEEGATAKERNEQIGGHKA